MKEETVKHNPFHNWTVLIVDDDVNILTSYRIAINSIGIKHVICCDDGRKTPEILASQKIELILLDLRMPRISGEEILDDIACNYPEIPVIITTGIDDIKTAVNCIRKGAFDYLVKPVDIDRLEHSIRKIVDISMLRQENENLTNRLLNSKLQCPEAFERIVTNSQSLFTVFQYCEAVSKSHFPVLITGETGTGKELIARAIHDAGGRGGKFVAVNMAGLDEQMINDTLFGHVKGGYTGADTDRKGLIEKASGGSVFLDEIGDLNLQSQVKLLRVIQEREFYPIGSDSPKTTDVRFIVATHTNLDEMQRNNEFRKDLFYRLRTHHVHLPPLRERKADIQPLFEHFLKSAARDLNKKVPHYPPQLLNLLELHNYPGNIRELQSIVYEALSRHSSKTLSIRVFKERMENAVSVPCEVSTGHDKQNWAANLEELPTLKEASDRLIEEAMKRSADNQRLAAGLLGISHQALNKRLKRKNKV